MFLILGAFQVLDCSLYMFSHLLMKIKKHLFHLHHTQNKQQLLAVDHLEENEARLYIHF